MKYLIECRMVINSSDNFIKIIEEFKNYLNNKACIVRSELISPSNHGESLIVEAVSTDAMFALDGLVGWLGGDKWIWSESEHEREAICDGGEFRFAEIEWCIVQSFPTYLLPTAKQEAIAKKLALG